MSLLPTTRITNAIVSNGGVVGSGLDPVLPGVQDEDILLVDFQPVVIPNSQILGSPSTQTAMYPLGPPPVAQLPGSHMVGMNHHHQQQQQSLSSDGVTTPISATGSSGKATNPNNFSLVSLSNHVHHNNNTSREESDFNYPPPTTNPLPRPRNLSNNKTNNVNNLPPIGGIGGGGGVGVIDPYDEDDEFARHQALAQPSYMANKRRSRRFNSKDNHNNVWDNSNHVGFHHQQSSSLQQNTSSLSSSEDSDTGFLMGTRKTAYTRKSVQRVVDPHPSNSVGTGSVSPSATTGLLPTLGNRKRVRRRRPSARNRKPANNQRDKIPNPSDVLSLCCCWCPEDPQRSRPSSGSSIRNRYLRLICFLIVIIVVAVLTSITLSLQRKVDSIDLSLTKLDQAIGSPLSSDLANGANGSPHKAASESLQTLISDHNALNSTVVNFKSQLDQLQSKLQDLADKLTAATSKPDGVAEVKGALAKLGSRVEELSATIETVQGSIEKLKNQNKITNNNSPVGSAAAVAGGGPPPPQSSITT